MCPKRFNTDFINSLMFHMNAIFQVHSGTISLAALRDFLMLTIDGTVHPINTSNPLQLVVLKRPVQEVSTETRCCSGLGRLDCLRGVVCVKTNEKLRVADANSADECYKQSYRMLGRDKHKVKASEGCCREMSWWREEVRVVVWISQRWGKNWDWERSCTLKTTPSGEQASFGSIFRNEREGLCSVLQ